MLDEKRYAVLIDADNISAKYIKYIIDEISSFGVVTYKRIYADWTTSNNNHWKDVLLEYSINPIQQYRYTTGKNSSDSALIIDAMDILYSNQIDGFCLVSSDSDFTKLATRLRESGMQVVGMGEQKTPKPFVSACNQFKYLDVLAKADAKNKKPRPIKKEPVKEIQIEPENDNENVKEKQEKAMTSIETICSYIVKTIIDLGDDNFGMNIGNLGHQITKMYPDFDTRYFGHSKFSKFLEELGLKIIINQSKQMVYLGDDLIPENEKPLSAPSVPSVPAPLRLNTKNQANQTNQGHNYNQQVAFVEKEIKATSDFVEDECYFNKTPLQPKETRKAPPKKIEKQSIDDSTKDIIFDILHDSSKLGIGLNLEYVHELILKKDPTFSVSKYNQSNIIDFFKSLDFIQLRELRDGGELVYLKTRFLNQNYQNQSQKNATSKGITKKEDLSIQVIKNDTPTTTTTTDLKASTSDFKITKIQSGIPSNKKAILEQAKNTPKIVAPQRIEIANETDTSTSNGSDNSNNSNNSNNSDKNTNTKINDNKKDKPFQKANQKNENLPIPVFTDEYKEKVKNTIYSIVKENGKNGIYIGSLGKIITTTYPDFDVRGFGFTKLSSFLKKYNFIKLQSKNMSRRNIWAYFIEK